MNSFASFRYFLERNGYNVSTRFAEKLGLRVRDVRIFFIYVTFATLGIWTMVYLMMAFAIRIKDLFYTKRSSVFDL